MNRRRYTRERTYRCHRCTDSGVVLIYHPALRFEVLRGERDDMQRPWLGAPTINVACDCDQGERWAKGNNRSRPIPRFDATRVCAVGIETKRESWDRFVEWCESGYVPRVEPQTEMF